MFILWEAHENRFLDVATEFQSPSHFTLYGEQTYSNCFAFSLPDKKVVAVMPVNVPLSSCARYGLFTITKWNLYELQWMGKTQSSEDTGEFSVIKDILKYALSCIFFDYSHLELIFDEPYGISFFFTVISSSFNVICPSSSAHSFILPSVNVSSDILFCLTKFLRNFWA